MKDWKHEVLTKYHDKLELIGRKLAKELGVPKSTLHDFKKAIESGKVKFEDTLTKPRILLIDIETAPILADVWQLFNNNVSIDQIKQDWYILSWSAKYLGEEEIYSDALINYPKRFKKNPEDDEAIVRSLYTMLSDADILVGHNIDKFDFKKSTARFVKYDLPPLHYLRTIDTLKVARREFKFTSNRLDYLARYFKLGKKVSHEGHSLWTKCQRGDPKAWAKMIEYNIKDVELLEQVYLKIRAWDSKHPNVALYYNDFKERCPCCGSDSVIKYYKDVVTNLSRFDQMVCLYCWKPSRRGTNTLTKDKRETILRNC